jgi:hypothetical protein
VQVKTFVPGNRTCPIGLKGERDYGKNFFWVLGGIPPPSSAVEFEYYVVPSEIMAAGLKKDFHLWSTTPGKYGQQRNIENPMRNILLPPRIGLSGFSIAEFKNRWDLIEQRLND